MNKVSTAACLLLSTTVGVSLTRAQEQGTVVRLDPALDNIVAPGAKLEQLMDTPGTGTREGPMWVRKGGYLIYCDRSGGVTPTSNVALSADIVKWDPRTGKSSVFLEHTQCDGLVLDKQGRIVIAVNIGPGKIVRVEKSGKSRVLASEYNGKQLNAPNEVAYKSDGALYFSDPAAQGNTTQTPSLYLLKGGKLTLLSPTPSVHITFPNGMALSPDEKHLYTTDNPKIMIFDVLPDDTIANGRLFIDLNNGAPLPAYFPDGIKVDVQGNVYCTGPGGIWIVSPEGKHLGTIWETHRPANLTFGGPDGKTLFVTSRPGLYRIPMKIVGMVH